MDKKKRLVLIGGGGHCGSVLDAARGMNRFEEIVITDPDIEAGSEYMGCRVAGTDEMLSRLFQDGFGMAFVSVGSITSTRLRKELCQKAKEAGFDFPNIIDPSAKVSEYAAVGKGIFIGKNAVVNAGARIGDMAIINTGAVVEHGCRIGAFSHVSVGAVMCGDSKTGDSVFVGANATVIQGVRIGMNSIIGAGSVVLKDVGPDSMFYRSGGVKFKNAFPTDMEQWFWGSSVKRLRSWDGRMEAC